MNSENPSVEGNKTLRIVCWTLVIVLFVTTLGLIFFPGTEGRVRGLMGCSATKPAATAIIKEEQVNESSTEQVSGFVYYFDTTCPKCKLLSPLVVKVFEDLYQKHPEFIQSHPLHSYNTSDPDDLPYCNGINTIPRLYYQQQGIKEQYPNKFDIDILNQWVYHYSSSPSSPVS